MVYMDGMGTVYIYTHYNTEFGNSLKGFTSLNSQPFGHPFLPLRSNFGG